MKEGGTKFFHALVYYGQKRESVLTLKPKLRVPEEYLEPIKEHAKKKGMSINQLVISLLEKDMGMDIVTIREQNKQNKENDEE